MIESITMQRSKNDIWVGLFVLLGLLAVLFLGLKAANLLNFNLSPTYTVTAYFDNIGGLKPKAAVKSAGVVVGRVSDIGFDDQAFQATVSLEMNEGFKFPKDSSFKILTSGLLGEQYIGIQAGIEEETLQANAVINNTQSAIVLEDLIGQFLFSKAGESGKTSDADAPEVAPALAAEGTASTE